MQKGIAIFSVLPFLLLLGGCLSVNPYTGQFQWGSVEKPERESDIRKKITAAVDKASTELFSELSSQSKIAVISGSSTNSDEQVILNFYKAQGYPEDQARLVIQQMDKTLLAQTAAALRGQGTTQSNSYADYAVDDLEYNLVKAKFKVVNRNEIEKIRSEQDFQYSGDVDDDSAVSIGKMAGAAAVITINVDYTDGSGRLTVKVLDVQTAEIITMARQEF
jgi:hypothetical protein